MKKSNNRGVSLIEILIAVVVFVICITPIINQLVSGIRLGQKADDQQAATDLGKSIAESIRQIDLSTMIDYKECKIDKASLADILEYPGDPTKIDVSYTFYSIDQSCIKNVDGVDVVDLDAVKSKPATAGVPYGAFITELPGAADQNMAHGTAKGYTSVTAMQQEIDSYNKTHSATEKQALVRELTVKWTETEDYRNYDISVVLDTAPYAIASLTGTSYVDPNAVNIGNLSNLDSSTTAVITAASSYDSIASNSYFSSVLNALERQGSPAATRLREGQTNAYNNFTSQTPTKKTVITVESINPDGSPDASGNRYTVKCNVIYDNEALRGDSYGNLSDSEVILNYPAYEQSFKTMPDIYLMYNQLYYFNSYGTDDIYVDNQTIGTSAAVTAKVYIVRTAETDPEGNSLIGTGTFSRDQKDGSKYKYRTILHVNQSIPTTVTDSNPIPAQFYTNIPLEVSGVSNVGKYTVGVETTKIAVDCSPADSYTTLIHRMDEDDRYSEAGRVYDVEIELQRWKGTESSKRVTNITRYSSSKGDS